VRFFFPLAAALTAAAAIAWMFSINRPAPARSGSAVMAVATKADTTVTQRLLEDGTVVELNRGAVLSVNFTPAERRVRLEQGEAHFTVTKNPARPFIVTARGMDVHAVGTAFNVRLDAQVVEVLVTEGRVRVSEAPEPAADGSKSEAREMRAPLVPLLQAGQRAVVSLAPQSAAPQIATLTPGEIERVLAWQHRMLDFTATPLSDVVAEFNRHNDVQLVVVDPELASIPISANFRSDNIEGFVRLLEVGSFARAERRGENEIRLRKAH
jgi:transmembrane sensor